MIGTNRYIGSPIERIEDLRFLRGRGQFVGDLKRERHCQDNRMTRRRGCG